MLRIMVGRREGGIRPCQTRMGEGRGIMGGVDHSTMNRQGKNGNRTGIRGNLPVPGARAGLVGKITTLTTNDIASKSQCSSSSRINHIIKNRQGKNGIRTGIRGNLPIQGARAGLIRKITTLMTNDVPPLMLLHSKSHRNSLGIDRSLAGTTPKASLLPKVAAVLATAVPYHAASRANPPTPKTITMIP